MASLTVMPRLFIINPPDFIGKTVKIKLPYLLNVTVKSEQEILFGKIIIKIFLQLRLHLLEFKIRIFHHSITGFKKRGRGAGFEPTPHDFCSYALPLY